MSLIETSHGMRFVGGEFQAAFAEQIRGENPERCLLVPIDVGTRRAEAPVADVYGQVVDGPFTFGLDRPGVEELLGRVDTTRGERQAVFCRFGSRPAVTSTGCWCGGWPTPAGRSSSSTRAM